MRVIEVEAEDKADRWLLWLLAGTAIGITAGVLVSEKFSGRRPNLSGLGKRLRGVARAVSGQWGPLVDVALELKDQWDERRAARPEPADVVHEDEEFEDADEYEAASEALDEDFGDEFEDFDEDEDSEIAARVLEAYLNDPILAERLVEIEADDDGDVMLLGSVRTPKEIAHAVTLARGVPGVTRVRQQLTVRARR